MKPLLHSVRRTLSLSFPAFLLAGMSSLLSVLLILLVCWVLRLATADNALALAVIVGVTVFVAMMVIAPGSRPASSQTVSSPKTILFRPPH